MYRYELLHYWMTLNYYDNKDKVQKETIFLAKLNNWQQIFYLITK